MISSNLPDSGANRPPLRSFLASPYLHWPIAILLFAFALTAAITGLLYPAELEARESTVWLHALTLKSGINILDHEKLAYANMNHGPLDSWIKCAIATVAPFLPSQTIIRLPVLLLLLTSVCVARIMLRGQVQSAWPAALISGSLFFLLWLSPNGVFGLVGRTDATCLWLMMLGGLFLFYAIENAARRLMWSALSGIAGMAAILTCSRYIPGVACMAALGALVLGTRERLSFSAWLQLVGTVHLAMAALFLIVFIAAAHADASLYYKHFIGFFRAGSGWLDVGPPSWNIFFAELTGLPWLSLAGILVLNIGIVVMLFRFIVNAESRRHWPMVLGAPILSLLWFVYFYAFRSNFAGGGLWYFAPFFLVVFWLLLLTQKSWSRRNPILIRALIFAGALAMINFPLIGRGLAQMVQQWPEASSGKDIATRLDTGYSVLSENSFLYKQRYSGELIDMGDVVPQVARSGFFEEKICGESDRTLRAIEEESTGLCRRQRPALTVDAAAARRALHSCFEWR